MSREGSFPELMGFCVDGAMGVVASFEAFPSTKSRLLEVLESVSCKSATSETG